MALVGPTFVVKNGFAAQLRDLTLPPARPVLVTRDARQPEPSLHRRTKIWEFNTNLHCSIIGTCLSTTELRQTLKRLGLAPDGSTDHELHGTAVLLAP